MESIKTLSDFLDVDPIFIALAILWTLVWKGLALWRSATLRQKYWFLAVLLINTLGILEIIYLFVVSRKYQVEFVEETK